MIDSKLLLQEDDAKKLRSQYLRTFVDVQSDYYQSHISKAELFRDGLCYRGYLWDCLHHPRVISEERALQMICRERSVYVMWDIHSCENILKPDYWKYPKDAVLCLVPNTLSELLPKLPEDVYFFNSGFSWTVALTHEILDKAGRYCVCSFAD